MFQRFALPMLLAPALLLGGCGTYNGGVDSVYQPVVERQDYVFDLAASGYSLAPGEGGRLAGWLDSMKLRYGDKIALDDGADGSIAREEVAAEAGRRGLILSERAPMTVGQVGSGTVRVIVTRMSAKVPNCPDFSRVYQPDFLASTSSNFGCSINTNLAGMIADPGDLVRGEPGASTTDPQTATKAVQALRSAAPSGAGGTSVPGASPGGGRSQ